MAKKRPTKEYTGSAYIGVVGPDGEHGPCRDSIELIARRPGDSPPVFMRATKGYEARQRHLNNFIDLTKHEFALLLDQDQTFPNDTLERLRSHKLPYVSGFYMRRNPQVLAPVWYRPSRGKWPMEPWVGTIEGGKLHPLGASGWGCMLVHRDVIMGVRALLKGEWEVLEDDMDIWPYDLKRIMSALRGLEEYLEDCKEKHRKAHLVPVRAFLEELKEEIRPLRCDRDIIGSDIRFPFFALQAGYQLYGDPDVQCGHIVNHPLGIGDYRSVSEEKLVEARRNQRKHINIERGKIEVQQQEVYGE